MHTAIVSEGLPAWEDHSSLTHTSGLGDGCGQGPHFPCSHSPLCRSGQLHFTGLSGLHPKRVKLQSPLRPSLKSLPTPHLPHSTGLSKSHSQPSKKEWIEVKFTFGGMRDQVTFRAQYQGGRNMWLLLYTQSASVIHWDPVQLQSLGPTQQQSHTSCFRFDPATSMTPGLPKSPISLE